jgi:acyl-CoA thioesterase-1
MLTACGGGSGSTPTPAPTPSPSPSPTPSAVGVLPYTASIKVAFVGASITIGATANGGTVWSAQTLNWLRSKYAAVEARDLSQSFTTSQFGAYRIDGDLQGYVPDLVFIEFAVNDLLIDKNARIRYTDALIYKLRRINPKVVIVYVAMTNALDQLSRGSGQVPIHITEIKGVVDRNQVHFIDAGAALWNQIRTKGGSTLDYLPDGIHPNEAGSNVYFAAVRDDLTGFLPTATAGPVTTAYIGQSHLEDARILPATAASTGGCVLGDQRSANSYFRFQQALTCSAGNQFTLEFRGTSIGLAYGAGKDAGALDCSIDGSSSQRIVLFDKDLPQTGLFLYANVVTGLPNGDHRVSCQVNGTPPSVDGTTSSGTRAVLAGFLVSQEQMITP